MDLINAIAKARFSSAKAQRVHLHAGDELRAELICMEGGQEVQVEPGQWVYYVVKGAATLVGDTEGQLAAGCVATTTAAEAHTIRNSGEQRFVCIAVASK